MTSKAARWADRSDSSWDRRRLASVSKNFWTCSRLGGGRSGYRILRRATVRKKCWRRFLASLAVASSSSARVSDSIRDNQPSAKTLERSRTRSVQETSWKANDWYSQADTNKVCEVWALEEGRVCLTLLRWVMDLLPHCIISHSTLLVSQHLNITITHQYVFGFRASDRLTKKSKRLMMWKQPTDLKSFLNNRRISLSLGTISRSTLKSIRIMNCSLG